MIRSPESTSTAGDSSLTNLLRRFLRDADRDEQRFYEYDDVTMLRPWPAGAMELFLSLGIIYEGPQDAEVWLDDCIDPEWAYPTWLFDKSAGRVRGYVGCGHVGCSTHIVERERARQWAPSFDGIAGMIQRLLGIESPWIDDVIDRVRLLGNITRGNQTRQIYLARGLSWPDAETMLAGASRLASSTNATVLCAANAPALDRRPPYLQKVLSLEEIVAFKNGAIDLPIDQLFDRPMIASNTTVDGSTPLLTPEAVDILDALAAQRNEPQLVVELVATSGYKRDTVMKSLKQLIDAGLATRPGGTRRKGVVITPRGLEHAGRLPKIP